MPFDPDLNIVLVCGQSNEVGEEDTVAPTAPTYPNAASMKMIGADGVLKAYSDPYADNTGALFATPYLNNTGTGVSFAGQMLNDLVEHFGGTWCATCLAQGGASVKYYPAPRLDSNPVNCGFWFDTDLSNNVQISPLLYATIQRIRHARTLGVIRYIVWGQGATDGVLGTDPEEFKTISTQLMAILRREAGGDVPIIRLGIADKPAFVAADEGPSGTYENNTWDGIQTAIQEYSVPNTTIVNPDGIAIQADQLHYTTSGYVSLGARIAAAITGAEIRSLPILVSGMLAHLDATNADSYPGTGQTFANLIENPADGETQAEYDFRFGGNDSVTGLDPSFLTEGGGAGVAGDSWSYMQFDGGDRFEIKENTAFLNKIHKTTEADLEVCFYMAFYWPTGITTGARYLFGNNKTSAGALEGFYFAYDPADQRFEFRQYHAAGTQDTNIGTGITLSGETWMAPGQWHFLSFGLKKTSTTAFDYKLVLNSDAAITGSGTLQSATNDPGAKFSIGGVYGSGYWPAGSRLAAFAVTNKFPTDAEIAAVRDLWFGWPFDLSNTKLTLPITETGILLPPESFTASDNAGKLLMTHTTDLPDATRIRVSTTGTLPTGLVTGYYYTKRISATTSEIATTAGGTSIDYTDAGTGTHTLKGVAHEIDPPELVDYRSDYFRPWYGNIRAYTPDGGADTSSTTNPRTELREQTNYPWEEGVDLTLTRTFRILETVADKNLTFFQIHEDSEVGPWVKMRVKQAFGVYQIKADVAVIPGGGDVSHILKTAYTLGDEITVTLRAHYPYVTTTVDGVSAVHDMSARAGPIFFKPGGAYPADADNSGDKYVVEITGGTDLPS